MKNRCSVTMDEVNEARALGQEIMTKVGSEDPENEMHRWRDLRDRAGEYFRRAADDIQLAAEFAFHNDPALRRGYPSLFSGKKKSRQTTEVEEQKADEQSVENAVVSVQGA